MSEVRRMAQENAQTVIGRPVRPTAPPWIFRPPWLHQVGGTLAIVGAVCVALGAPCAVVGVWVPSWLPVGLWVTGCGLAALVLGLVAVVVGRRMRP